MVDDVAPVVLDASDPASARHAFAECGPVDVVYYLVHAIGEPGFREVDQAAAANVATAAREAGVRRIVYLGGFVPDGDDLSEHLASRAEVADALTVEGAPNWYGWEPR
ncbi:NADH(P)-binding family protein [Mycobacterium xenopi 4042]|uniref:NADH(P)-binding family protein n=1 Tax=Mycobacterium xenopi 4042 TaxID=1299334 RepID=X8E019_MYCXE|nr:NADH(P)-binding family protein [Mycobacterium xenopi 4042]